HGDIRTGILGDRQFDVIVFAATIEHFASIKKIIHLCLAFLKTGGEIHIIDTPFCRADEVKMEERRMLAYYTSFGYPEMAEYYYHPTLADLRSFHFVILYNPKSVYSRLLRMKIPHP